MDKDKFDVVLNMDDKNFAENLANAIGLKKGEQIEIITPQFERTDGVAITYIPKTVDEYHFLKGLDDDVLISFGLGKWDEGHWLYPHEWYNYIPNGLEIVSISGKKEHFVRGETDDDMRFGLLAYGFIRT